MIFLATILYILLISSLDALMYGVWYERDQSKAWLFNPIWKYRVFQKVIEIGGMAALFLIFKSWAQIAGLLAAFYFMTNEFLYYIWMGQLDLARGYEKGDKTPHWLSQPYQFGFVLWRAMWWAPKANNYSFMGFAASAVLGLVTALSLCFI